MVRTQGKDSGRKSLIFNFLDGVEDGSGVVHHTKGINHSPELLFLKAVANLGGKARTHEEHLFTRADTKPRIRYVNNRPKLYQLRLICNPFVERVISTKRAFLF